MSASPAYLYIVTHTARYLDVVLAGLSRQTRRPDHVVVSCDTDDPAIGEVIRQWADAVGAPVTWARRSHHGIARCSQVRNNAVRFLVTTLGATEGRIIQIDGDVLCPPEFVESHVRLGGERLLVYPYRVNVGRDASEALDAGALRDGAPMPAIGEAEWAELRRRDRRARRQRALRGLRLAPMHKPKLLGCNWSAPLRAWIELNGFDEQFQGWGFLDDEFARRAAIAGWDCVPAAGAIPCFHLWHATRQPRGPMSANPNYGRFVRRDLPVAAENGLRNEIPQHPVTVTTFG